MTGNPDNLEGDDGMSDQLSDTPGPDDGADDDYEECSHYCDEECEDYQGFSACTHQHCMNCGGCGCPGYCDDYQTYNLRPAETGGA
jgi:hypothetical protein